MALCNFCRRSFRNSQAVRAHLRHCKTYQGKKLSDGVSRQGLPSIAAHTEHAALPTQPTPSACELHDLSRPGSNFKALTKTQLNGLLWSYETLWDVLCDLAMLRWLHRISGLGHNNTGPSDEDYVKAIRTVFAIRHAIYCLAKVAVVDHEEVMETYESALGVRGLLATCLPSSHSSAPLAEEDQNAMDGGVGGPMCRYEKVMNVLRSVVAHAKAL